MSDQGQVFDESPLATNWQQKVRKDMNRTGQGTHRMQLWLLNSSGRVTVNGQICYEKSLQTFDI